MPVLRVECEGCDLLEWKRLFSMYRYKGLVNNYGEGATKREGGVSPLQKGGVGGWWKKVLAMLLGGVGHKFWGTFNKGT